VPSEVRHRLDRAGVRLEERRVRRLVGEDHLRAVELEDGTRVARDILFAAPPQRQVALVQSLGLALDEQGFVLVNEHKETSVPGIHAAGDLTTRLQAALVAAAAGVHAAAMMNHALNMDLALERPRGVEVGTRSA
jgi:thioredoxin reductase